MEKVYILVNFDIGWDCVVGVFRELNGLMNCLKDILDVDDDFITNATLEELDDYLSEHADRYAIYYTDVL